MFQGKRIGVIVPAAGRGKRMGSIKSKQFLDLNGIPVLIHVLIKFERCNEIDVIAVAIEETYREKLLQLIQEYGLRKICKIVTGGAERQDSVRNCLNIMKASRVDIVVVHDSVRPFVSQRLIKSVLGVVVRTGAAVAGVRVKETIKKTDENNLVLETPAREQLWIAQTPQAFSYGILERAYEEAKKNNFIGTDDSGLVERLGFRVEIVEGDYDNIKITTPEDLPIAEGIARRWILAGEID